MAMESSKIQIRNCLVINCSWASALPWNESVRAVGSDKFTLLAQCTELHFKPIALGKCLRLHNHLISVSQNCGIPCSHHTVCLCKHTDLQNNAYYVNHAMNETGWFSSEKFWLRILLTRFFYFIVFLDVWDGSPTHTHMKIKYVVVYLIDSHLYGQKQLKYSWKYMILFSWGKKERKKESHSVLEQHERRVNLNVCVNHPLMPRQLCVKYQT